jgi:hypothetical protein
MPATSEHMMHFMQMARAVKHGHVIKGMSKDMNKKLHKAADSMTEEQLVAYSHMAKKKKS